MLGWGLSTEIDARECLIINMQDPIETEVIMNRCFSMVQILKNLGTIRDYMCNK